MLECGTGAKWLVWQKRDIGLHTGAISMLEWGSWWQESQVPVPHTLLRDLKPLIGDVPPFQMRLVCGTQSVLKSNELPGGERVRELPTLEIFSK